MSKVCPNSFAVTYNNKAYVFKSETMLRSQLVRPKDAVDPAKQDGVVYRIPCKCRKVYIGRLKDLCNTELRSTIEIFDSPVQHRTQAALEQTSP